MSGEIQENLIRFKKFVGVKFLSWTKVDDLFITELDPSFAFCLRQEFFVSCMQFIVTRLEPVDVILRGFYGFKFLIFV